MFLARVVLRPSHYSAVRGRAVHVCDGWWTRYTITCKRFFRPARQPFGDQRHRSQACLGGTAASAWIASGASCVALATLATVDCAGAQDLAGSDDAPAAESVDADGDSEVPDEMPFELPEWFDVESECRDSKRCAACAFFCDTPCRRAYFQSVECYESLLKHGYNGKRVSKDRATQACDHFTLRCWGQHKEAMAAVLKAHAARFNDGQQGKERGVE